MENKFSHATLFEVSWEVCNKVGGIYAVVRTKTLEAVKHFGDNYYLLGPDLGDNPEFEETQEPCWDILKPAIKQNNLICRFGRWNIPGRPKVILVNFKNRYNENQLLFELWSRYGVDSLSGGWDYIEPVMFSTACGEVIATACQELAKPEHGQVLAHFHEWMCGGGLLEIKKLNPKVATIFTTHATMLGRSMAGSGFDIYKQMHQINPKTEAGAYNIIAKCSMETASAKEADCFTTVSNLTADEGTVFLGRRPDVVTPNGLDLSIIPDFSLSREAPAENRRQILAASSRLLRCTLPENTRIFLISGRYEFHNKGIDVFIDALAGVNSALHQSQTNILALCAVMGGHSGINHDAVSGDVHKQSDQGPYWICSHHVYNPPQDPILRICSRIGLDNRPDNKVKIIFIPTQLDGQDGFLNLKYYDVMSACDLGVFPSWYEPWGYTPQESAALAVPTVTTDLSGFGHWVRDLQHSQSAENMGVTILPRRQTSYDDTVNSMRAVMLEAASIQEDAIQVRRQAVRALAGKCSWNIFFPNYLEAYKLAHEKVLARNADTVDTSDTVLIRMVSANATAAPVLHNFTAIAPLPKQIGRLRELSRNLWWSWNTAAQDLFAELNPEVWEQSGNNPVLTLEKTSPAMLEAFAKDQVYLRMYKQALQEFDAYMKEPVKEFKHLKITTPAAYFSMEYGIAECLPIYSGGLGVLSGDHMKSASDLNIPLVGIGLLYKSGYFRQQIDKNGRQIALYPENNFADLPIDRVLDSNGNPVTIMLDLPGRHLHAQIWIARVGRIPLYLMDTDMPQNTTDDRKITARLYEADRDFRLRQEMLLGIGGVRLLKILGLTPSSYHMNEGHSAFLILERMRRQILENGFSFGEAEEYVRTNSLFTTHTPVEAGNEHFTADRMKAYFTGYVQSMGISWQDFMRMGRIEGSERNVFEMTVLALNYSLKSNGVSAMHGVVSRHMWQKAWPGIPTAEIPIGHITNGIHVPSYVGQPMKVLLDRHLGADWMSLPPDSPVWERIMDIPDNQLWAAKILQKNMLIDKIKLSLQRFFKTLDVPSGKQKEMLANLNPSALFIGFARRFAPYKRATLLFADPSRLSRILSEADRPVILVFSGKAHPADVHGADIMQTVINYMLDERFFGKIFFIEDYSLAVSRAMVRGCDVWLNTPRRPYEASGTSGQKVSVNGGINLSVSDGWWCEGYSGTNGWTIGQAYKGDLLPAEQMDYEDAESLYQVLEESVIPLFFDRNASGFSKGWMTKSKLAMSTLTAMFHSNRMVNDYTNEFYTQAATRNNYARSQNLSKKLALWKRDVAVRFNSLKMEEFLVDGLDKETLVAGKPLRVRVLVNPGQMLPAELLVQLVAGPSSGSAFHKMPDVITLKQKTKQGELELIEYEGEYIPVNNGVHVFGVRIMPITKDLHSPLETKLVLWG